MTTLGLAVPGAVLAALALIIGLELRPATREDIVMRDTPTRIAPASPPSPAATTADRGEAWVRTILARPLFAPSRRPPAIAAASAGSAPAALPRVAGIMIDGGRSSVIFAAGSGGKPLVVSEGADVNGFKVQRIEPGAVTVLGPGGQRVLHPAFDPNPPAPRPVISAGGIPGLPSITGIPGTGIPGLPVAGQSAR